MRQGRTRERNRMPATTADLYHEFRLLSSLNFFQRGSRPFLTAYRLVTTR